MSKTSTNHSSEAICIATIFDKPWLTWVHLWLDLKWSNSLLTVNIMTLLSTSTHRVFKMNTWFNVFYETGTDMYHQRQYLYVGHNYAKRPKVGTMRDVYQSRLKKTSGVLHFYNVGHKHIQVINTKVSPLEMILRSQSNTYCIVDIKF